MAAKEKLKIEIGTLKKDAFLPYFTDGSWSLYQLLEYVLEQTGSADVYLSAFSLNEDSVRSFVNLKDEGQIKTLSCLLNDQIVRFKTDMLIFVTRTADAVFLAPCHAKLIIIENKEWQLMIIGSANFNRNLRYECGSICTIPESTGNKN